MFINVYIVIFKFIFFFTTITPILVLRLTNLQMDTFLRSQCLVGMGRDGIYRCLKEINNLSFATGIYSTKLKSIEPK